MDRNKLKAGIAIILLKLVAKLPLTISRCLGAMTAWCVAHSSTEISRVSKKNIDICFGELDPKARRKLTTDSIIHTGYLVMEIGAAWFRPAAKNLSGIVKVTGQRLMDEAVGVGRGVIVVAPHLGNWEWANIYTSQHYPGVIVYSPPKLVQFDKILRQSREIGGGILAPATAAGVKAVYKHLKKGGVVYILPDQVPGTEGGLLSPFFGVPALTMTLVSRLVNKTGAMVVAVYGKRLPDNGGFELVYKEVDERIYSPDLQSSVDGLNATVEACIREAPEQYQWSYKRFKRSPSLGVDY